MSTVYLYSPQQAYDLIRDRKAIAVDVREPADYQKAHLPGAVNLPEMFSELSMSTPEGVAEMTRTFVPLFT